MDRTHGLRVTGMIGLVLGMLAMLGGGFAGELGGFISGYGLLVVLSAAYLLLGVAIRERLAHRPRTMSHPLSAPQPNR